MHTFDHLGTATKDDSFGGTPALQVKAGRSHV